LAAWGGAQIVRNAIDQQPAFSWSCGSYCLQYVLEALKGVRLSIQQIQAIRAGANGSWTPEALAARLSSLYGRVLIGGIDVGQAGVRSLQGFLSLSGYVITMVRTGGSHHYVVVVAMRNGAVLYVDPATGGMHVTDALTFVGHAITLIAPIAGAK